MPKKYCENYMLTYDDVVLVPRRSSFPSRSVTDPGMWFCGKKYELPIVMSPMSSVTSPEMIYFFFKNKMVPSVHRYFNNAAEQYDYVFLGIAEQINIEDMGVSVFDWKARKELRQNVVAFTPNMIKRVQAVVDETFFAIGSVAKYKDWIDELLRRGVKRFCVDMAHGDSDACLETLEYLAKLDTLVMAGNIATPESARRLEESGADAIRANIGSGAACTTRIKTGFGVPSVTCIMDIANCGIKDAEVIADGGIREPGDIVKALYFGADMVMLGSVLAATDLSPSRCFNKNGEFIEKTTEVFPNDSESSNKYPNRVIYYKEYVGMASALARRNVMKEASVEGEAGFVRYRGKTSDLIAGIKMNLQSALSYGGCANWEQFRHFVEYGVVSNASILEGRARLDGFI